MCIHEIVKSLNILEMITTQNNMQTGSRVTWGIHLNKLFSLKLYTEMFFKHSGGFISNPLQNLLLLFI